MATADNLIAEANSRIESLHSNQSQHAESLNALQQILLQQTATLHNQSEILKSIRSNDSPNNTSLTTITSTGSTLNTTTTPHPLLLDDNTDN
jgi:hypothetical protein